MVIAHAEKWKKNGWEFFSLFLRAIPRSKIEILYLILELTENYEFAKLVFFRYLNAYVISGAFSPEKLKGKDMQKSFMFYNFLTTSKKGKSWL